MTLKGDTLLQIQKWWDAIISVLCQSLSTNKIWSACKSPKSEHRNRYYFIIPPDISPKFSTAKENYEQLSIALRFQLFKDETIPS